MGRFRSFVGAYPGSKPAPGAGAHPLIVGTGWDPAWDAFLPEGQAALTEAVLCDPQYQTWTILPGANENLPMNCLSWYIAFAFCAWDGGRLPTEAEWNYAAAGGLEQREYPWSSVVIDSTYANFECSGYGQAGVCSFADMLAVGSRSPKGDGRWAQADLGGSMWEWTLDGYGDYSAQCSDCVNVLSGSGRVIRGGSWNHAASNLLSAVRQNNQPASRGNEVGARCARTP